MTDVTAVVPGHVTGFFTVDRDEDPTKAGSRGAGLALSETVAVTVDPGGERAVYLGGASIDVAAVETVLDALRADVTVRAETALPLGAGFGVSGALALGTALATNAALERELSRNELVTVAHGAEVEAGTGLGDVVAQAAGGMPIRLEPGGPQDNRLDAIPARPRVEFVSFGDLDTESFVGGDTDRLTQAGREALSRVVATPTPAEFGYASRRFAREAGLLTERVREAVRDVAAAGGEASMAMLGDTVFAFGTGLSDAGYDPVVCRVDPAGARLR